MINGIISSSKYVRVFGGYGSSLSGYVRNTDEPYGNVRYYNGRFEVHNGNSWQTLPTSTASIGLDPYVEIVIEWAQKKIQEEVELETLAKSNETIKNLLEQKKLVESQIEMVKVLTK
jgi:hypothetical protein